MSVRIASYRPEHLEGFVMQPEQARLQQCVDSPDYRRELATLGPAYSAIVGGRSVCTFGVWRQEKHCGLAWGLVSRDAGPHFPLVHKAVRAFLDSYPILRLEMRVDEGFERGHRWAAMLGFESEGVLRHVHPDGTDAVLYARINPNWSAN